MEIAELVKQRKLTRAVAELFTSELRGYLQSIAPLINPRTVFGEHIHGSSRAASAHGGKALERLQSAYEKVRSGKPFDLRQRFDTPIALLGTMPEIQPVTYRYTARTGGAEKTLTVTAPLKWVLSYEGFGLQHLRQLLSGQSDREGHSLQDAVLHGLMLAVTLDLRPGVSTLLQALRFPLSIEQQEEFGNLPIAIISSPLATQLPDDQVIVDSTEISGSDHFEEIVASSPIDDISDPLKEKLQGLIAAQTTP